MKRIAKWSMAIIALIACAGIAYWATRPSWPVFPAAEDSKPQVQVLVERDYAYRIGDVVSLEVVIRQQPGTRVQVSTFTVSGDFELHEKVVLESKELKNGEALYRLRFKLQSFEPKPRLSFSAAFSWDDLNKNEQHAFNVPEKKIGTGMTWDGRTEMQEGTDSLSGLWYWVRAVVPLVFGSALFLYFLVTGLIRWWIKRKQPTEAELIRDRFRALLATVRNGTCQCEGYREMEGIVRKRWLVEAVPVEDLNAAINEPEWKAPVEEFLALTALGIYPAQQPSSEELASLPEIGEKLVPGLMKPADPKTAEKAAAGAAANAAVVAATEAAPAAADAVKAPTPESLPVASDGGNASTSGETLPARDDEDPSQAAK